MDRHLDTVWLQTIFEVLILCRLSCLTDVILPHARFLGGPRLLELLQGRPGQGQDDHKQGNLQEVCADLGKLCLLRPSHRYEIEWIGREGLAPETHDAYLKVICVLTFAF